MKYLEVRHIVAAGLRMPFIVFYYYAVQTNQTRSDKAFKLVHKKY